MAFLFSPHSDMPTPARIRAIEVSSSTEAFNSGQTSKHTAGLLDSHLRAAGLIDPVRTRNTIRTLNLPDNLLRLKRGENREI